MIELELSVLVNIHDQRAAKEYEHKGASTILMYPVVPRIGEFFTVHTAIPALEVKKVTHWGPGFIDRQWTEIEFEAPLKVVNILLTSTKEDRAGEWERIDL